MQFMVKCLDKPGHAAIRAANRAAHLDYLAGHAVHLLTAGPLFAEDGETMLGSLLIVDFADRVALERFLADDPYAKAGLFETVETRRFRKVFPKAG